MSPRRVIEFSIGPVGTALISLLTVPAIAWYFPTEDVGRLAMLQVGISFCLLLFSLGLDQAYVRDYHEASHRASLFKACLLPGLTLLILALAVTLALPGKLSQWLFDHSDARLGVLAAVCILGSFLGRFFSLILRMQEKGLAFSLSQLLPKLTFLAVLALWVLMTPQHNLYQLLVAHGIALTMVALLFGWNTRAEWSGSSAALPPDQRKRLLQFGLPLVLSGMAFWAMTSFDRIFLRNLSSFEQLGIYSVANSFAGAALVLQSIFSTMWAPIAYRWHAEGAEPQVLHRVSERLLAVVILAFALGGQLSWVLGYILPAQYRQAQYIVLACLAYPLLYTLGEATSVGLGIARKSGHILLAAGAALCVNVLINYSLVPQFGAAGAASATALSFLTLFILRTELSSRLWIAMPRARAYALTSLSTALAVGYALLGDQYAAVFAALWLALLGTTIALFRKDFAAMLSWLLRNKRTRDKA